MLKVRKQIVKQTSRRSSEKCCLRRNAIRAVVHATTCKDLLMIVTEPFLEYLKTKIAFQIKNKESLDADFQLLVDILRGMYAVLCYTAGKIKITFNVRKTFYCYRDDEITIGPASDLISCYNLGGFPQNDAFFYLLNTNIIKNYLFHLVKSSETQNTINVELYKNIEADIYLEVLYPRLYDLVVSPRFISSNLSEPKEKLYDIWEWNVYNDPWKKIRFPEDKRQIQKNSKTFGDCGLSLWYPNSSR